MQIGALGDIHGAFDIVSLGSDGQEGGSGTAADISLDTMTSARND